MWLLWIQTLNEYWYMYHLYTNLNATIEEYCNFCHCHGATLHWQHNGRYGVSSHQPHHCLLNRLFRQRSMLIGPLWTNFSEIWIKMQNFSFVKMYFKMSSAKRRPFRVRADSWCTYFLRLLGFTHTACVYHGVEYIPGWHRDVHHFGHIWLWKITGPVSISDKTSYRGISQSLEGAIGVKMFASLWNLTGASSALLPMCLSNFRAIRQF